MDSYIKNYQIVSAELHSLQGTIFAPPSKSHTLRALLFSSLARGKSIIKNALNSPDTISMILACQELGAQIDVFTHDTGTNTGRAKTNSTSDLKSNISISIIGTGGKINSPKNIIQVGNSGQVLRFITAISALNKDRNNYTVLTGDKSIISNRPMDPLIKSLNDLGAFCVSTRNNGHAPIVVSGGLTPGKTTLQGEDSQPISALLIATSFLNSVTEIEVINPGEKPWIDLTLDWLKRVGIKYENHNYKHYVIYGNANYSGFEYQVPGDFSSLIFPLVAALITKSNITINNVNMQDVQGDKKVIEILKLMGAKIDYDPHALSLIIRSDPTSALHGIEMDVNDFIDALPILAVVGCFARGTTKLRNAAIARSKECDRLQAISTELKKMGASITELPDGLIIKESPLRAARVETHHDHRLVMSLAVAALGAQGETIISDIKWVEKSYPSFYNDMQRLGANISIGQSL